MTGLVASAAVSSVFGRIGGVFSAGLSWITASLSHGLAALLALACLFGFWQWHEAAKWHRVADSTAAARKADTAAWNKSVADAKAATALAEKQSKESAQDADALHTQLLASDDGLRDYIASHRLRSPTSAATAPSATEAHDPGVPAVSAPSAILAVSESDLRACDADYAYSRAAFEWGQSLIAKGLAGK